MPKVSPIQDDFSTGEISALFKGRVTSDRYKAGLDTCLNYLPTIQGGLTRRPGTKFVAEVKTSSKQTRLVPFEFSTTQAYMLEFGDQYIRVYKNNAEVTLTAQNITAISNANPGVLTYSGSDNYANGDHVYISGLAGTLGNNLNGRTLMVGSVNTGTNTFNLLNLDGTNVNTTSYGAYTSGGTIAEVYEVNSTYAEADLFQLKFAQSADTLYITHPSYPPKKLTRTAHTSWTLTTISFLDGPYLDGSKDQGYTLSWTGALSIGAHAITAGSATFVATDVGRLLRIKHPGSLTATTHGWAWGTITAFTDSTHVTLTVVGSADSDAGGGSSQMWTLGLWSATTGYPGSVVFHEDRLFFAGTLNYPLRVNGSCTGDYENFAPTGLPSPTETTDSNAVAFSLNANDVNVVRWLVSDEKALVAGAVKAEWAVRPSSQGEGLTPTNISAKKVTSYGSADIQPVQAGKATLFIQRAGRKLREFSYSYDVDGFRAPDMTVIAEHITRSGLKQLAYQGEPHPFVWAARTDGVLLSMVYERDIDKITAGWARHVLGGTSDAADNDPIVESVAVIPSADGTREEVWMIVKRYVNGSSKRYVEYMTKTFEDGDDQRDAYFVDGGLSYDNPLTISAATKANPVVVTATAHGFSNGDKVYISEVEGMTQLNGHSFVVANKATDTFELTNQDGEATGNVNGTAFSTYVSGGEARKYVSTITGLWHLEGETVDVIADASDQLTKIVSGGSITLSSSATVVHIGYSYRSRGKMLRIDAGAADGTSIGKTRRTHQVGILLFQTLGLSWGTDFNSLDEIVFRKDMDSDSRPVPLFSGIEVNTIDADYDYENQICWEQDRPFPGTILAVFPQMVTQDRG